jgi:hypothetical protein
MGNAKVKSKASITPLNAHAAAIAPGVFRLAGSQASPNSDP